MIQIEAAAFLKSLDEAILTVTRKLENMVRGFAYEFTLAASDSTPIGDYESLYNNGEYASYYRNRQEHLGIPFDVGFHRGAWQANTSGIFDFTPNIYNRATVGADAKQEMAYYKLGDSFYVGATGPAYYALLNGSSQQAPKGAIVSMTEAQVESMYRISMQKYYDQG